MSVILKGIDMPKEGEYYNTVIESNGEVLVDIVREGNILEDCLWGKAILIPEGHGRLIDADALFKDLKEQQIPFNSDINSAIIVAPTIFESEEE